MSSKFNSIPIAVQERGRRNMSATTHLTSDFGRMDVVYHTEVVPGENVSLKVDSFLRSAPMPAPTFGAIDIDHRAFFVPYRILCNLDKTSANGEFSWDDFITGRSSVSHPYFNINSLIGSLHSSYHDSTGTASDIADRQGKVLDCLRLLTQLGFPSSLCNRVFDDGVFPIVSDELLRINPFALAAYNQIWWDYYRDSQQIDEQYIRNYVPALSAGENSSSPFLHARNCCFRKDYFNTAKIYPQSGASNVTANGQYLTVSGQSVVPHVEYNSDNVLGSDGTILNPSLVQPQVSSLVGIPIQWLRAANSLQKYLERNNLAGTRLMERFLARFGVSPSHVALNMAEYIGGNRSRINIGDVTANNEDSQTSEFTAHNAFNTANSDGQMYGTIQGQLGGKSVADNSTGNLNFRATEFGVVMVIQTIVPNVGYSQGLRRQLFRGVFGDRFDYFTPEMENIGYQEVKQKELFFEYATQSVGRFGFQPRYSDYKYQPDVAAGDLVLSPTKAGMDSFHLFRQFREGLDSPRPSLYGFSEISMYARNELDRIFSIKGGLAEFDHYNGVVHTECHIDTPMSNNDLPSLDEDVKPDGKRVDIANGGVRF